ncbi:MAG: hypothetical protein ACQETM_06320 [Bacteroidota bacterium]
MPAPSASNRQPHPPGNRIHPATTSTRQPHPPGNRIQPATTSNRKITKTANP